MAQVPDVQMKANAAELGFRKSDVFARPISLRLGILTWAGMLAWRALLSPLPLDGEYFWGAVFSGIAVWAISYVVAMIVENALLPAGQLFVSGIKDINVTVPENTWGTRADLTYGAVMGGDSDISNLRRLARLVTHYQGTISKRELERIGYGTRDSADVDKMMAYLEGQRLIRPIGNSMYEWTVKGRDFMERLKKESKG